MLGLYLSLIDASEDKNKFEELYYTYRKLMFYVAKGILNDRYLAEEALQEAFLRIAKNFHKIGEVKCHQTRNFVVIIVKNVALTMVSKENKLDDDEIIEYISVPDEAFEICNYREIVAEIGNLSETYRDVLYLRCVCDYSIGDIEGYTGLNRNVVKKRLQRGREILREKLKKEGYHE